jgi:imidazolonepropionase-like amidohydrolase
MGFGTDLLGETHDQQSREFQLRAEVLSPADVIRSATVVNARILNRAGELGVIAPGALADLLIIDGNPLENLSPLADPHKHLRMVMKAGTEFRF